MTSDELKQWRKSLNVTQKEFAVLVGQGERTVQVWESGQGIPEEKVDYLRVLVERNYAKLRIKKDSLSSLPHQKVEIMDKHGSTSQVDAVRVDEMEDYTRAKEIGVSLIPQYEEGFRGGNEGEKDEIKSISTYWGLPNVAGQSMYPVRGDSMAPKYPANCKVVIKNFAFNPAEPFTIPFGETFAVAVNVNGALNYYVKRLFKHPDRDKQKTTYIARSYNPEFEDFEIPIQNIAYLGIVVARVSVDITCNY